MLDHALAYARVGIPVIPVHGILDDGSCTCGTERCHSPGKHPRTPNGLKDATTDERQIRKWWGPSRWPNANIAGVGGRFLCLDIDAKSGGLDSLKRLIESHAKLPDTAIAETGLYDGERGRHYWFRVPEDVPTPGSRAGVRVGIDIRCAQGYALLPPSVHASGVNYEWLVGDLTEVAEAPPWVLDLAPEHVAGGQAWAPNPAFRMSRDVKDFLHGELDVPIGEQRDFLVKAARSVLTTGRDVETTAQLLWEGVDGQGGIESCDWESDDPWTPEDIYALVADVFAKPPTSPLEKDFLSDDFTFDDIGNGKRLVRSFQEGHLLYVPELDRWHVWDTALRRFVRVSESWMRSRWDQITYEIQEEARQTLDEDRARSLRNHARASRMKRATDAAVSFARDFASVSERVLDADPMRFAASNGLIDLRTGELYELLPEDLVTRHSPVEYDPDARSTVFEDYLKRTVPDEALRDYLQMACGYTLTGSTDEEAFFYLYGRPGSGKSTLTEAMHYVMGNYALSADTSSFMRESKRAGNGPSEDLARLAGSRMVSIAEVEANDRLATGLVNRITSGEPIAARRLYGKTFEYTPRFKLWVAANHLPRIGTSRSGVWRRVKVIAFDQVIKREDMDPMFRSHKIKEPEVASAILTWMVEGAIKWAALHARGKKLEEPSSVVDEVIAYQKSNDHTSAFIEDAVEVTGDPKDRVPVASMFAHYRRWCDNEGRERRDTQHGLSLKLRDAGLTSKMAHVPSAGKSQRCWIGVVLKELPGGVTMGPRKTGPPAR